MKKVGFMEQKHGSHDFPFDKFNIVSDSARVFATNHWHSETEIIFVENGEIVVNIEGEEYTGRTGDIFVINSSQMHEIFGRKCPLKYTAFIFDVGMLESKNDDSIQRKYFQPLIDSKMVFENKIESATECFEVLKEIDNVNDLQQECYELITKAELMRVFAWLIKNGKTSSAGKADGKNKRLKEIIAYAEENYMQEISLPDIAKRFNMSHKYFCRYFKKHFHKTFVEYLNDVRIEKARQLLDDGAAVTEAALSCGFNNMSYFTLIFKRKMGCTPSQYKKIHP